MSGHNESIIREPLITGDNITYAKITDDILARLRISRIRHGGLDFPLPPFALLWVVSR